ncbi:MAG TPA: hypothetical protein PLJ00_09045 [Chitinophagales bacterium]|nr:hypothetical protein [Chitinophagales bacterium]HRG28025.1 hypothetical protein [Chitinophagales bacterium]HRH54028.1 hypothetical protein [Chitinophagales bacterium]
MNNNLPELPFDFPLTASDLATKAMRAASCKTFADACRYVALLPYRRNQDKKNMLCVAEEKCGTCSTKHTLLKKVAEEHDKDDIHLVIGIYFLNQHNTPKAKPILNSFYLRGFPEAHCYLTFDSKIYDFTFPSGNFNFAHDLLEEHVVTADEVATKKSGLHKEYLRKWAKQEQLPFTHEKLWDIRELCIAALSL